uniref:Uncharacterized protein n=1 Tax=Knipowitschia caucasica TaxID=637954 RepID=A0AAV2IZT9_KNICA
MSKFSERNPSPGRLHVSAEPPMEQMEVKQKKCDIPSLGEIMLQFDSPGVLHDETETQLKTEQTSSCEPTQNQELAPQSCLNQEPVPQSSLTKPGPKKQRKQKPTKDLQDGLEEPNQKLFHKWTRKVSPDSACTGEFIQHRDSAGENHQKQLTL